MPKPLLAYLTCLLFIYGCSSPPTTIPVDKPLTDDTEWYARMSELPRHYRGAFQWDASSEQQRLEIWFDSVGVADSGEAWIARGRGIYRSPRVTRIDIKARINFETGEFQMWEANPDAPGFTTNGYHIGHISEGFRQVEATWKGEDGNEGKLRLTSVDAGE